VKLLRAIRLDPSDTFVFDRAAEPGEWAVSGAFMFWNVDPLTLEGKPRAAFRSGFLGVNSFGWSTLVQIVEASDEDRRTAVDVLARRLLADFGAPSIEHARAAAEEEMAFACSLCGPTIDTLVAVHRSVEQGEIHEAFRTLQPREKPKSLRARSFAEGEEAEEPVEDVDLIALARGERP
jgi:uncharacterized protein DUF6505